MEPDRPALPGNFPTVEQLLSAAILTVRDVLMPAIADPWPGAAAGQLTGMLEYARRLTLVDPGERRARLTAIADALRDLLGEYPALARELGDGSSALAAYEDPTPLLGLAGQALAFAVGKSTAEADAVRRRLRPLLAAQLAADAALSQPMLMTFRGDAFDGQH